MKKVIFESSILKLSRRAWGTFPAGSMASAWGSRVVGVWDLRERAFMASCSFLEQRRPQKLDKPSE